MSCCYSSFKIYKTELLKVANQNELSGRTCLENLLNSIKKEENFSIDIIHEAKPDLKGLGSPDFRVNNINTYTVVGYIENKKLNENLSKILKTKQIEKYKKLTDNLILTNYLDWIWIYKGQIVKEASLCSYKDFTNTKYELNISNVEAVYKLIVCFFSKEASEITKVKDLAEKLARPSIEIKKYLFEQINIQISDKDKQEKLFGLYSAFKDALFEELKVIDFADSFAQMFTYAIFLAKINNPNVILNLQNAKENIPIAFKLIKTLVEFLDLLNSKQHSKISWAVENILSVINNINITSITEDLQFKNTTNEKDPYIYFYEDFLKEYDTELRVDRGVYYTPPAIVEFIIREVSNLLVYDFNLKEGLANKSVKLLDFASGTGTFLFEVFKLILQNVSPNSTERTYLIKNHILKNIYGFELLISAYIICHLKLSQFLKENGYDITEVTDKKMRIQVYLTNTLEYKEDITTNFLAKALGDEGENAKKNKR